MRQGKATGGESGEFIVIGALSLGTLLESIHKPPLVEHQAIEPVALPSLNAKHFSFTI
jgi:hypothetical protein